MVNASRGCLRCPEILAPFVRSSINVQHHCLSDLNHTEFRRFSTKHTRHKPSTLTTRCILPSFSCLSLPSGKSQLCQVCNFVKANVPWSRKHVQARMTKARTNVAVAADSSFVAKEPGCIWLAVTEQHVQEPVTH